MLVVNLHTSLVGKVDAGAILSFHLADVSLFANGGPKAKTLPVFGEVVRLDAAKIVLAVKHCG